MSDFKAMKITDNYGFTVENTPMDEMRVITPTRLVGSVFNGNVLDTNFWSATTATTASVVCSGSQATLSTGTGSTASAMLTSVAVARYIGGSSNRYRAQIQMSDNGTENCYRQWGVDGDGINGAYFELSGTSAYTVTMNNTVATKTLSSNWSDSTTLPTFSSCTTYELYFTNKTVYFIIDGVLKHKHVATLSPWTSNINFRIFNKISNAGNTTNCVLYNRVSTIARLGQDATTPRFKYQSGANAGQILKYGPGCLHRIVNNDNVGTLNLYDALSATNPIATIDLTKVLGSICFDVEFNTGLYFVTTGAVFVTIIYE